MQYWWQSSEQMGSRELKAADKATAEMSKDEIHYPHITL